jgi:hypothetical protein
MNDKNADFMLKNPLFKERNGLVSGCLQVDRNIPFWLTPRKITIYASSRNLWTYLDFYQPSLNFTIYG